MSHDYEKDANATSRYAEDLEIIDEYIDTHQQANPFSLHYTKQLVQSLQDCHKELEALKEKAMERDDLVKKLEDFIHLDTEREAERRDLCKERDALRAELITRVGELQVMSEEKAELAERVEEIESGLAKIAALRENINYSQDDDRFDLDVAMTIAEELLK